jgi:hypothetical protein
MKAQPKAQPKTMTKAILAAGIAGCICLPARAEPCAVVAGSHILGRDLAAAVPDLAGLDPEAEIAPAPWAGVERVFHTEEVARIAREHALPPPGHTVEACFMRKTLTLTPEQLGRVIERTLSPDRAGSPPGTPPSAPPHVEILDFSRYPVPEGTLEFPRGALAASGVWRGRIVTPEGRSAPVWVRVKITDASTGLPVLLGPSAGYREVQRGDPVRVEISSGLATVAFDSVAESSGRKGDMVLLWSPDKRRRLLARVEDQGKVSVKK